LDLLDWCISITSKEEKNQTSSFFDENHFPQHFLKWVAFIDNKFSAFPLLI
jgi:hypothetical protein